MTDVFHDWEEAILKAQSDIQSMGQDLQDLQQTAQLVELNLSQLDEESQSTQEVLRVSALAIVQLVQRSQEHEARPQQFASVMRDSISLHRDMLELVKELRADVNANQRALTGQ